MDVHDRYQHGTTCDFYKVEQQAIGAFSWVYAPEMHREHPRAYTYFYLTYSMPALGNYHRFGWRIRIPGVDSDNELIPAIDTYNSRKAKEDPSWKLSQP